MAGTDRQSPARKPSPVHNTIISPAGWAWGCHSSADADVTKTPGPTSIDLAFPSRPSWSTAGRWKHIRVNFVKRNGRILAEGEFRRTRAHTPGSSPRPDRQSPTPEPPGAATGLAGQVQRFPRRVPDQPCNVPGA